ncbi:MAG: inositol monophosphatase family protein [Halobacteria archaeon]|nr:inositol monophosphatase family protein [Halobacteria archaeon]
MSLPELRTLEALLVGAAETELLPRLHQVSADQKADGSLVTEADLSLQQRLTSALGEMSPDIPVLGEELPAEVQQTMLEDAEQGVWCLDPLDGTRNFACGFPVFAISLALIRQGKVELGLVYDPLRRENFSAAKGKGAWLNGEPLSAQVETSLASALALIDFKRLPVELAQRLVVSPPYPSQRSIGSGALDWCWLAAGRVQVYLHGSQHLWDYAAGQLILAEAGGRAVTLQGEAVFINQLQTRSIVAGCNAAIFEEWAEWLGINCQN